MYFRMSQINAFVLYRLVDIKDRVMLVSRSKWL